MKEIEDHDVEKEKKERKRQLVIICVCLVLIVVFAIRILNSGIFGNGGLDYTKVSDSSNESDFASYTMYVIKDCQVTDTIDAEEASYKIDLLFDTAVTVIGLQDDYYQIRVEDGRKAYIQQDLLTSIQPKEVDPKDTHWEYEADGLSIEINKYSQSQGASSEDLIVYWVADVIMDDPDQMLQTTFAGGDYESSIEGKERCSVMAKEQKAIFAVNGDACGFRGDGGDYEDPILIRNGKIYHEDDRNIGEMLAIYKTGKMKIFSPGDLGSAKEMVADGVRDTFWFDTALVKDGKVVQALIDNEQYYALNPYTAIGQVDDHHYVFICVDGRESNGSIGVTYTGMARLMQKYGCITAYELDGGGSTTMYFDGMILNEPSDGRERSIADAICIVPGQSGEKSDNAK